MTGIKVKCVLSLIAILSSQILLAQEKTTADLVIERYLEVVGGHGVLLRVYNLTITMSVTYGGQTAKEVKKFKSPNIFSYPWIQNQDRLVEVTSDGRRVKIVDGVNVAILPEGEGDFWIMAGLPIPELQYPALGVSSQIEGRENVNGVEAVRILNETLNSTLKWVDYYDTRTGLKSKTIYMSGSPKPEGQLSIQYAGYRDFDGLKLPSVITVSIGDMKSIYLVEKVKVNGRMDESGFKLN